MSAHVEYRCDICAASGAGRWQRYSFGPAVPKGWHGYDGKHLCSYDCLIEHIKELARREDAERLMPSEPLESKPS